MIVNITQAKARFLELVERAEAGEEVIIMRRRKPVIRLAPTDAGEAIDAPTSDEANSLRGR